jgi:hypothetical protein
MNPFETPEGVHSGAPLSAAVADAVMRATGILALLGIAVIHLVQLVPTFQSAPVLGAAFVALIAGTLVVGAPLVSPKVSGVKLWLPIAALGVMSIVGYAFTRITLTPLDNEDVGNWSCMLGIAALFVEGTLVVLSAYAMSVASLRHPAANGRAALTGSPYPAGTLAPESAQRPTPVSYTNGSRR